MEFSIGGAFSAAFNHLKSRFGVLLGTAALFTLLPLLVVGVVGAGMFATLGLESFSSIEAENPDPFGGSFVALGIGIFVLYLAFFLFSIMGQSALAALMDNTRKNSFGQAIGIALRTLPALILVMIIALIAYFAFVMAITFLAGVVGDVIGGLLAFALGIGLLFVAMRLSVTLPVIVLEGVKNPITALSRAWSLTGQDQWRLIGYYVLVAIALFALMFALFMVVGVVVGIGTTFGGSGLESGEFGAGFIVSMILVFLFYMVLILIFTVMQVACVVAAYQQFVGITSVADTFD